MRKTMKVGGGRRRSLTLDQLSVIFKAVGYERGRKPRIVGYVAMRDGAPDSTFIRAERAAAKRFGFTSSNRDVVLVWWSDIPDDSPLNDKIKRGKFLIAPTKTALANARAV